MTETIGTLTLCGAVLAGAGTVLASIGAVRFDSLACLRAARWLVACIALLITIASVSLIVALETSDFRIQYVAEYSQRAMPAGYKFAALWAGQAGSLLLWTWLLSILCVVACVGWRRRILDVGNGDSKPNGQVAAFNDAGLAGNPNPRIEHPGSITVFAVAHATLAVVAGFFAVLLLFTANPFQLIAGAVPADGRGLNPQLQDWAMIIHPPLLFTGYAGFTIPFAMLIGVLAAGVRDNRWLALVRRWVLFSWMFLGAGIIMGAWWAYIELGWGGYWAWDPVENASLLPWLTATALIHSIIIQQHRGMFRFWNASLISLTFLLCIFGTYLTRSGVIDSVHAFAESLIGTFFLIFLVICTLASAALILWRRGTLRSDRPLEGLVSREGAFLAGNVLLLIMMMVTLVGTIFPLIGGLIGQPGMTVKPVFYNRVVAPMGIGLVGLMALAPVLAFGLQAARKIAFNLRMPALCVIVVTASLMLLVTTNVWAVLCVAIVTLGTATVIVDFAKSLSARRRSTGEAPLSCALSLIDKDHRRYGGQLAHLGVMMIVIGVAGSSLFSRDATHRVRPGDTFTMGGYPMRFAGLNDVRGSNFSAVEAALEVTDSSGRVQTLTPQVRFYDMWSEQPNAEIAVRSNWREDLYVSLAGWEGGGQIAALQVRINPVVLWIWVGGVVMVLGSLFCMLPRLLPRAQPVTISAADQAVDAGDLVLEASRIRAATAAGHSASEVLA